MHPDTYRQIKAVNHSMVVSGYSYSPAGSTSVIRAVFTGYRFARVGTQWITALMYLCTVYMLAGGVLLIILIDLIMYIRLKRTKRRRSFSYNSQ